MSAVDIIDVREVCISGCNNPTARLRIDIIKSMTIIKMYKKHKNMEIKGFYDIIYILPWQLQSILASHIGRMKKME